MFKTVTIPVSELLSVSAELCCPWEIAPIQLFQYQTFQILNERALQCGEQNSESILVTSLRWLVGGYWWVILVLLQKIFHQILTSQRNRAKKAENGENERKRTRGWRIYKSAGKSSTRYGKYAHKQGYWEYTGNLSDKPTFLIWNRPKYFILNDIFKLNAFLGNIRVLFKNTVSV